MEKLLEEILDIVLTIAGIWGGIVLGGYAILALFGWLFL